MVSLFERRPEDVLFGRILNGKLLQTSVSEILSRLDIKYFETDFHKLIFRVICDIHKREQAVDLNSVGTSIPDTREMIGCVDLLELANVGETYVNENYFIDKIIENYAKKKVGFTYNAAAKEVVHRNTSLTTVVDKTHASVSDYMSVIKTETLDNYTVSDYLWEMSEELDSGKAKNKIIKLGIDSLDHFVNCKKGNLIIIAARPSVGKTAFAQSIVSKLVKNDRSCAFFSLEMTLKEIYDRFLSFASKVPLSVISTADFRESELDDFTVAAHSLNAKNKKLYVRSKGDLRVTEIYSQIEKLKRDREVDVVVIDYLQLLKPTAKNDIRERDVAEVSRDLKSMALELEVVVVALSQLNRSIEMRANDAKKPRLSDIRESGAIEQDADVVIGLHREAYYDMNADQSKAEAIILKNRNGSLGTAELKFVPILTYFT